VKFLSAIRRMQDRQGQTLVEFAICALLAVMLMIGVIEMGRLVLVYTTVCNAARIGVRYAMVHGSDNSVTTAQIQSVVNSYLSAAAINTSSATVSVAYPGTSSCSDPGCPVQVTVSYPYQPMTSYFRINVTLGSTSEGVITF
jgi:Flp pilus assembly protein TadG